MKVNKLLILPLVGALVLSACQEEKAYESEVYKDVTLTLDRGERWDMPNTMKAYMDSSLRLVATLDKDAELTPEMCNRLDAYKDGFVGNCSMEGEGHDMLHAWLLPYMDILEMASEAKSAEQKEKAKNELLAARELYLEFFE